MTPSHSQLLELAAAITGAPTRLTAAAVDVAVAQGVAPLLAAAPAADLLDPVSHQRLIGEVHGSAIHAAALDDDLRRLLPLLADRTCVPAVVIKGAHLAHAVYRAPHHRPRTDTDLLISARDQPAVIEALAGAGYRRAALTSGRIILGQFAYRRTLGPGVVHDVDVHWRVAAPLVFAASFDVTAIAAASVPIASLGACARGPSPADALSLACVHVVAHHWPEGSLRWWHDLHLLASCLDDDGRRRFATAAARGRFCGVAMAALDRARVFFPSPSLDAVMDALLAIPRQQEPSAQLTRADRRAVDDFLLDLKVAGWRGGATLVREHLLPPPSYMRLAFAGRPLPFAYAERLVKAVTKRV